MEKIYSASRALAVLLAIVAAFVAVPHIAVLLLVFGGVAAIGNNSEMNSRNYLIAIVLTVGAKALEVIPVAGAPLASIFANIGIAYIGASVVAVTLTLANRIKSDWIK